MSNNLSDGPRGGTMCMGRVGLAIGDTTKTGPALVVAASYCIDGIGYITTAAATVKPLTAVATPQAALTKCLYLICVDASFNVTSVKGREVLVADLVAGNDVLEWPEVPVNKVAVGAVKVETGAVTFTPGTTALDAANITETYYNIVGGVPVKPLAS